MRRILFITLTVFTTVIARASVPQLLTEVARGPSVLVLYDGPDDESNPGRLDAFYLTNLLGHFTIHRKVHSLDTYQTGEAAKYDAVFSIVYEKHYTVPEIFLDDIAVYQRTFCWLSNQIGQLDRVRLLQKHGIHFLRYSDDLPLTQVLYKGKTITKHDDETNLLQITDASRATAIASVTGSHHQVFPYIIRSGSFWVVADSPFSYASEDDRYYVFCDVLHDILGIEHPEDHRAILRIEDINALSDPNELRATLNVIRKYRIPFAFGYVPAYINPHERLELRLSERPQVVSALQKYVQSGGVPVLHGFTHQYRGVTTDDYEFWDDLGDRPVRGDSEAFASHRLEEAIKESTNVGLYPVTWETPHYAASELDYHVIHRYFATVFERRLAGNHLGSDQFFPYPVIDMRGQFVIPEDLGYIPLDHPQIDRLMAGADAASVVRDGYASFFFHPFVKPELLDDLLKGFLQRGFQFTDIRSFPNEVHAEGRLIKTMDGVAQIGGKGYYLTDFIVNESGRIRHRESILVTPTAMIEKKIHLSAGETYVALRQDAVPPNFLRRLVKIAKGDISDVQHKFGTVVIGRPDRNVTKVLVLWNSNAKGEEAVDQSSFLSALNSLGFDVEQVEYTHLSDEELGPFTLLVIPRATARALSDDMVSRVLRALTGGITLITDGGSPLSEAMGIRLGEAAPVTQLHDNFFTNQETRWSDHPAVESIAVPRAEDVDVYYADADEERPLVIGGSVGEGRYVYLAPLFDPLSGQGYSRFPNFAQILLDKLKLSPMAIRSGADTYFDPGYRPNVSIEVLAKMWHRYGIRTVHVAGWGFYEKYTYDYARLLKVAHQNGILVYAWFEWPHLSQRFWNQHPNWRDKTALLSDAHVDWRYLMNLQDPQCLKAALADLQTFLKSYDWDGVDLGELTFESPAGPEKPQSFTPFNRQARQAFQARAGFDPVELFQPASSHYWKTDGRGLVAFYDYRREENARLLGTFLDAVQRLNLRANKNWDIVVTLLDVLQHPDLSDYLGIDLHRSVDLINSHGATLQVEDPASDWILAPDRYLTLGQKYKALSLAKPFMIDINVLPVHLGHQPDFATPQPTGIELAQLWRAASTYASRVCLYSEASIFEQDWQMLPYAMAAHATVRKEGDTWVVNTPNTIRLDIGREARRYRLDNQPWYCADKEGVLIPAGEHTLSFARVRGSWFDTSQLETRLVSITGELLGSQRVQRGLDVEYSSPHRCVMVFNKLPYKTYIDDLPAKLTVVRGDDGYSMLAPPGEHRLRVISETPGLYLIEFTSLVSASLIVLFGLVSSGLFAILFLFITLQRRTAKIRRALRKGSQALFGLSRRPSERPT